MLNYSSEVKSRAPLCEIGDIYWSITWLVEAGEPTEIVDYAQLRFNDSAQAMDAFNEVVAALRGRTVRLCELVCTDLVGMINTPASDATPIETSYSKFKPGIGVVQSTENNYYDSTPIEHKFKAVI